MMRQSRVSGVDKNFKSLDSGTLLDLHFGHVSDPR